MITRMIVAQQDRSNRQQAQLNEELVQSSKMAALGKLAAGVAHEVNNPLAVIREKAGWMRDLLEEEDVKASPNFQEFEDAVTKIEQHVERAGNVVHRMLGFARRMEPVCNDIHINDVLRQTTAFLDNEMRFRGIELAWNLDHHLPTIQSDAAQIQQGPPQPRQQRHRRPRPQRLHHHFDGLRGPVGHGAHQRPGQRAGHGQGRAATDFRSVLHTPEGRRGTGLGLSISYSIISKLGAASVSRARLARAPNS
jgi:two-component system NtrC family sensor kinase